MTDVATGPGWELRCGRWQDVLADVEQCDAIITDPPYSERTHSGHDDGTGRDGATRRALDYSAWSGDDIAHLVELWSARVEGWWVVLTDHTSVPWWSQQLEDEGHYVFAPLPYVAPGSRVRLAGDGPSSWTTWLVVARPRTQPYSHWGTLPGAYVLPPGYAEQGMLIGGKPLWLMRALVRDYSEPGDLIVDPCAGSGTTLLAAVIEGRSAIGAECDPATYELAVKRLRQGYTPAMDFG